MEDNSYVSLSLEKYNELYDKAKALDKILEVLSTEESAATEEVVEELDNEIKVRDKVKLLETNNCTNGFKVGDICTVTNVNINAFYEIEIKHANGTYGYVHTDMIKKINEREEN